MDKKKAGQTLTADEQAKLTTFQANNQFKWGKGNWNEKWFKWWLGRWFNWIELTDAEKQSLTTMTAEQKKAFFEQKMQVAKTEKLAHDSVIDKLLAWLSLTTEEETLRQTIIKERATMKVKQAEMQVMKAIMQKSRNGEALTADEQAKLTTFQASHSIKHWTGKWFKK